MGPSGWPSDLGDKGAVIRYDRRVLTKDKCGSLSTTPPPV